MKPKCDTLFYLELHILQEFDYIPHRSPASLLMHRCRLAFDISAEVHPQYSALIFLSPFLMSLLSTNLIGYIDGTF